MTTAAMPDGEVGVSVTVAVCNAALNPTVLASKRKLVVAAVVVAPDGVTVNHCGSPTATAAAIV